MSVKDGLPSTDFSRMNREWVKAVAGGGSGGGGGLPDITPEDEGKVLTVENGEAAWGAGSGGVHAYEILLNYELSDESVRCETVATAAEIVSAYIVQKRAIICPEMNAYSAYIAEATDEQQNEYYTLNIYSLSTPGDASDTVLSLTYSYAEVLKTDAETEKFQFKWDSDIYWDINMTPAQ